MKLVLDDIPFTTAIEIIKYCHSHGIDMEQVSVYYDRIHSKKAVFETNEPWEIEIPDHLITFFRMKYGGLE